MKLARPLLIVAVTAALLSVAATPATAEGPTDKLKRGLAGLFCGFVEVPGTLCEETRHEGPALGLTAGWFKCAGNFLAREFVGLYEFLTFPISWPDNYKPYMQPAYPWDRFTSKKEESPVPPPPAVK
ncbi:MAG: exosortase system-associated protein, TIGR04073 family [Verrucomicrobia bacterium]|nr:exosortase system-associated protein, TIGR04073 family [Verrucomicrobiota bacterium]